MLAYLQSTSISCEAVKLTENIGIRMQQALWSRRACAEHLDCAPFHRSVTRAHPCKGPFRTAVTGCVLVVWCAVDIVHEAQIV